jgi:trimeric autotransporter adhesin
VYLEVLLNLFYNDATGNVGVGTAAPVRQLDVYDNSTVQIVAQFANSSSVSSRIKFADLNTGAENVNIGAIGTRMAMWTNNTERMSILSGGNVGIGTTTPLYPLDVLGEGKVRNKFRVGGAVMLAEPGTGVLLFGSEGGSQTAIYSSSTERIRINGSGNVGIGTTSPSALLHVATASTEETWSCCSVMSFKELTVIILLANVDQEDTLAAWENGFKITNEHY